MKKLIMTIGLPRSGKSTWAKRQKYPIVEPDAIRLAIHGQDFIKEAEPYVWVTAQTMVKSLFLAGHNRVILSATSTTIRSRNTWLSNLWGREFVVFETPLSICISRAIENQKPQLVPIIIRMDEEFEELSLEETGELEDKASWNIQIIKG